ncbi:MAG: LptF/LptG family permease [Holosporales bacterium]
MSLTSPTLVRYHIKNYLKALGLVLVVVTLVIGMFDLAEILRKAALKPDVTPGVITQLLVLRLPNLIERILPFIFFFAAVLTLWRMNRFREVDVLRASGLSIWQMLMPLALAGSLLGAVDVVVLNPVFSKMMRRHEKLERKYLFGEQESLTLSDTGLWMKESLMENERIFHANHVNPKEWLFRDVTLFTFNQKNQLQGILTAEKAQWQNGQFVFSKAWMTRPGLMPQHLEEFQIYTGITPQSFEEQGTAVYTVSFWDLPRFIHLLERAGLSSQKYLVYWHSLWARMFWLGIMVFLAAAFALRPLRQGHQAFWLTAGIALAFALYVLRDISYALGSAGTVPAMVAAWIPVGVSLAVAAWILLHLEDG